MAKADRLDVPVFTGELPALLDQAPCLLKLAQEGKEETLKHMAKGVGTTHGGAGPDGGVAISQLDGTIAERHRLAVLAAGEERIDVANNSKVERGIARLLGQGERP